MRRIILLLLIACARLHAQNIEGQIVASQFGQFQVPGTVDGNLQFPPASCQVSAGGNNFSAFEVGVPIKIVDSDPALTEIGTPMAVFIDSCSVSMSTTYLHSAPFYLTSGTGGLQEALSNGIQDSGGPNTVILNADWYTQVKPANPATVIGSVKGSTTLGLIDVTTTPYTAYAWDGTQYTLSSNTVGPPTGAAGGGLTGNYPNPGLAVQALPPGTTASTQTTGDSSAKLATDGFVQAAVSPLAPLASPALTGTPTAPTQAVSMNNTDLATTAAVTSALVPYAQLASPPLTGTPTAPTQVAGDNSTKLATTANTFNSMPSVSAAYFGANGDAYAPPDGCSLTASSTTVTCPDAPFVSTDVGKQLWLIGGGASGVAFHATISSVTSSSAVVASAAASASVTQAPGNMVYGHDDSTAVQACFQYSASNAVQCALRALPAPGGGTGNTGFLIGSAGVKLVPNNTDEEGSATNVAGASPINGTDLFCEYNGDCLSLAPGPIAGAIVSNIGLIGNPSQPNGRGIHLNAAAGTYNTGGLWNSTFTNILVSNFALECLWSDGGGGAGYTYNLPNQIDTFNQFQCDGPAQSHPANLIKMTGQHAQIVFINGQANGGQYSGGTSSYYPNWLIAIEEKTSGLGDSPSDVKFYGYTYEVGTQGLYIGEGASNIHFNDGYVENISSPYYAVNSNGLTFNGNHIANSGNVTGVLQYGGLVTGSARDNYVYGSAELPAAFAVCSNNNTIDFAQNTSSVTTTSGCATVQVGPSTSTYTSTGGQTNFVNGSATTITTIVAPQISPGKTLTLYAGSSPGITLATGGNINMGGYGSPLTIPSGSSVTLTLYDLGPTWLVTATSAGGVLTGGTNVLTGNNQFQYNTGTSAGLVELTNSSNANYTSIYMDGGNTNIDAKSNTGGEVITTGSSSGNIAIWRATTGGPAEVAMSTGGNLTLAGSLTVATARKGTFTCTAGGTITIANTNELNTSDVVISLNTAGGTISTPPAMKTVTAGTGFTVLCGAADTSTYNYDILN